MNTSYASHPLQIGIGNGKLLSLPRGRVHRGPASKCRLPLSILCSIRVGPVRKNCVNNAGKNRSNKLHKTIC